MAMEQRLEDAIHVQELPFEPVQEYITTNILCPNCTIENLTPILQEDTEKVNELKCDACGHGFYLIDTNTVKFK